MNHANRYTLSALALGIAGVLAFGQAQASGFQLRENSVKNVGRANAGSAVAENDASVVANNPAAMVNLDQTTFQADVTVIDLNAEFSGGGTTALGTPLTGGNGGDPGDAQAVPAFAVVVPMNDTLEGLTLGASVSAPFGLKTEYEPDWMGRYNAIESDVRVVDLTLSAALAVNERFSVGVGLIYEYADVTLSNAIDFGTALCAGSGNVANCFDPAFPYHPQANDGALSTSGDDTSFGWIFGMQFKPTDRLSLGLSYRSEVDHDLEGTADFTLPASVAAYFDAVGITAYNDPAVTAPLTNPSVTTLSVQYDVSDRFRLMADAQQTGWSSLAAVEIYRKDDGSLLGGEDFSWSDTWLYSVGGEFDLNDAVTLRAGLGQDETPTNDRTRTPRLPDEDRWLYSVGLTWNVSPNLSFDASYMRITIDSSSIDVESSSSSLLNGSFDGDADLFGVSAQYRF